MMGGLHQLAEQIRCDEVALTWEGTFAEYFDKVCQRPELARLSHARIYDMIVASEVTETRDGVPVYSLFAGELFGLERPLQRLVAYFSAAARRLEVRKRIVLLMGPPGGGKSTIVELLKRGLEAYTRQDAGAVYAIKGCPMQEEPLHLIPPAYRPQLQARYGLYIEGDLCPYCRWMLREEYGGDIEQVRVRRITFSERDGIGIGTFVATDPGSEDLTRLVGSLNPDAVGHDRLLPSGRAWQLNGELNVANRGLTEIVEMLKMDERFLGVLLVLSQEQKIKAVGFGTIYADEALIAHTNEAEYQALVANPKTEALQDRLVVIRVPYNLRVKEEVRIYRKMLGEADLHGVHLSPLALPVAATFAVLSRLAPSKRWNVTPLVKLRLYDGRFVPGFSPEDVAKLQEEAPREGMQGISPRYVVNRLAHAVTQPGLKCLEPLSLLRVLWDGIEQSTSLAAAERERLGALFLDARREYEALAQRAVQRAFVPDFAAKAEKLFRDYLVQVEAFCEGELGAGFANSEVFPSNEALMRSLERLIGVGELARAPFRREIWSHYSLLQRQGQPFDYSSDPRLQEAVELWLCPDLRQMAHRLVPTPTTDAAVSREREQVIQRLINEHGYCTECAITLVDHVSSYLARGEGFRVRKAWDWLHLEGSS